MMTMMMMVMVVNEGRKEGRWWEGEEDEYEEAMGEQIVMIDKGASGVLNLINMFKHCPMLSNVVVGTMMIPNIVAIGL